MRQIFLIKASNMSSQMSVEMFFTAGPTQTAQRWRIGGGWRDLGTNRRMEVVFWTSWS